MLFLEVNRLIIIWANIVVRLEKFFRKAPLNLLKAFAGYACGYAP